MNVWEKTSESRVSRHTSDTLSILAVRHRFFGHHKYLYPKGASQLGGVQRPIFNSLSFKLESPYVFNKNTLLQGTRITFQFIAQ